MLSLNLHSSLKNLKTAAEQRLLLRNKNKLRRYFY
jgi:hypothetical protein